MQSLSNFRISVFEGREALHAQYVTNELLVDFNSMEQHISTYSWSPSIFHEAIAKDGVLRRNRKKIYFSSAQVFAIDIDNGLSLSAAIKSVKSLGLSAIIGTTKSHQLDKWNSERTAFQPACDRFRIVFFLAAPIQTTEQYRAVYQAFKNIFPMCDDNCKDSARFFYPCKQIVFKNVGNLFEIDAFIKNVHEAINHPVSYVSQNQIIKGILSKKTLDFIAHGAPNGEWHNRLISALFDLKQQGYSVDEATVQIKKASLSAHGDLDTKDIQQIKDIYENREVMYPPRLQNTLEAGPQPLFRELPPELPFPTQSLGNILGPAVESLTKISKAPVAMCAQSILAAATLAVQPHRNVYIDGRTYPISQFFVTVGESGERKSAVDNEALKSHREFERQQVDMFNMEQLQFINEKEVFEHQRKKILNTKKAKEEISRELEALGIPPSPPLSRIILIQEPTFEGLLKLYENGQPSIGLFSDEGGRMLGGHGMSEDNQLKTIAGFSTIWDGKAISKVRAEAGSKNIYGKRLSLHLMLQPLVAQQLTGNSLASDQGFLSRCLFAYPKSTVGSRMYVEANNNDINIVNYHAVISRILNTRLPLVVDSKNELQPEKIELDFEAKKIWIKFHDHVEKNLSEQGQFHSIRGFGAKAAEHALRMAAILTLVEDLRAQNISKQKMQSAIELVHFYLSEALRLFSVGSINPDLLQADKLLRWFHNRNTEYVHIGQVYRYGPNSLRDKDSAKKIIKILEDHGHLYPVSGGMVLDGAHRNRVWQVIQPPMFVPITTAISANPATAQINSLESQKQQQIDSENLKKAVALFTRPKGC